MANDNTGYVILAALWVPALAMLVPALLRVDWGDVVARVAMFAIAVAGYVAFALVFGNLCDDCRW
jgi:hypothetical protein